MKFDLRIFMAVLAVIFLTLAVWGGGAINAGAAEQEPWQKRCSKPKDGKGAESCEIFQKLVVAKSGARFVEFAIGYPADDKKVARGVFILPLGILLENGVKMTIDDGQAFKFNVRYCDQGGCYAFISLNEQLIDLMKKGSEAKVNFVGASGQAFNVGVTLKGFTTAVNQIR